MEDYIAKDIDLFTRSGYYTSLEVVDLICEDLYCGEVDEDEVEELVDESWRKLKADRLSWPAVVDADRVQNAFTALRAHGILAQRNAGRDWGETHSYMKEMIKSSTDGIEYVGYCFYVHRDVHDAIRDGELRISFGTVKPDEVTADQIGKRIVEKLVSEGFSPDKISRFLGPEEIEIDGIDWKSR